MDDSSTSLHSSEHLQIAQCLRSTLFPVSQTRAVYLDNAGHLSRILHFECAFSFCRTKPRSELPQSRTISSVHHSSYALPRCLHAAGNTRLHVKGPSPKSNIGSRKAATVVIWDQPPAAKPEQFKYEHPPCVKMQERLSSSLHPTSPSWHPSGMQVKKNSKTHVRFPGPSA